MAEIRNPNLQTPGGDGGGSGGDMRGMMVLMLVVLVVFFGFDYFRAKQQPPPAPPAAQSQTPNQPQPMTPAAATAAQPVTSSAPGVAVSAGISASTETLTTIENEEYKIVFTNRGAQVKSWVLKKYLDTAGKPLDMVQPQVAQRFGYPLSLFTYEPALTNQLNQALYQVSASGEQPSATGRAYVPQTNALSFHYAMGALDVVKTVRFDSSYVVTVEAEVKRDGSPVRALVEWPAGLGDMEEFVPGRARSGSVLTSANSQFTWSMNGKQDSVKAKAVSGNATLDQPYEYAAVTDLYFATALLPDVPERATVVTLHNSVELPKDPSNADSQKIPADVIGFGAGDTSGVTRLRLFVGPKETDLLKTVHTAGPDGKPTGPTLESLIQYGWLTIIAKPLYLTLRFIKNMLGSGSYNWGWAIIIFTAVFTVIMIPFRFMALKSSLKMMRVQPKVEAIKNRYKNLKATDPKRAEMNAEMMELYKVEGVNMYGGCLPMLPQIPLFFAYFRVLQNAVELRQAHWFWLSDLSSPDPLYILPILIIISMFLVQMMTPSPGMDPNQRRMMAFMMPLMMGFFLLHYASGLALYWGTSNIINLALQVGINQSHIGKEMHAIAAKRAYKRSGGNPKTIQGRR